MNSFGLIKLLLELLFQRTRLGLICLSLSSGAKTFTNNYRVRSKTRETRSTWDRYRINSFVASFVKDAPATFSLPSRIFPKVLLLFSHHLTSLWSGCFYSIIMLRSLKRLLLFSHSLTYLWSVCYQQQFPSYTGSNQPSYIQRDLHKSAQKLTCLKVADWLEKILLSSYFSRSIGIMVRMFANGPRDQGSIPGRVIPKTQKMVPDASLLNAKHYKVWIKGKGSNSEKGIAPSPASLYSSYWKWSLRVAADYGRPTYNWLFFSHLSWKWTHGAI